MTKLDDSKHCPFCKKLRIERATIVSGDTLLFPRYSAKGRIIGFIILNKNHGDAALNDEKENYHMYWLKDRVALPRIKLMYPSEEIIEKENILGHRYIIVGLKKFIPRLS